MKRRPRVGCRVVVSALLLSACATHQSDGALLYQCDGGVKVRFWEPKPGEAIVTFSGASTGTHRLYIAASREKAAFHGEGLQFVGDVNVMRLSRDGAPDLRCQNIITVD